MIERSGMIGRPAEGRSNVSQPGECGYEVEV